MICSNKNSMPYDILRTRIRKESFVKLLSEERKRQKISQKELGRLVGLEGKCISAIENGKNDVTLSAFMLIADALGLRFSLVGKKIDNFLTLEELENLWDEFGDIPIDEDECIDEDFYIWEKGTDRYHIWHWFDDKCPNGLAKDLMGL